MKSILATLGLSVLLPLVLVLMSASCHKEPIGGGTNPPSPGPLPKASMTITPNTTVVFDGIIDETGKRTVSASATNAFSGTLNGQSVSLPSQFATDLLKSDSTFKLVVYGNNNSVDSVSQKVTVSIHPAVQLFYSNGKGWMLKKIEYKNANGNWVDAPPIVPCFADDINYFELNKNCLTKNIIACTGQTPSEFRVPWSFNADRTKLTWGQTYDILFTESSVDTLRLSISNPLLSRYTYVHPQ